MAEMSFVLTALSGKKYTVEKVLSYEWSRDIDAPCDSLRLSFIYGGELGEIRTADVYYNGSHVMNGFVDYQRESDGKVFIYARSTACLLVDNEASQLTYHSPCADSLYLVNAMPFGFKNCLKNYFVNAEYTVTKGTSCYGAINNFVSVFTNRNVAVSPGGELYIPEGGKPFKPDESRILSTERIINRGRPVSRIDFKTDGEYNRHFRSRTLEEKGISRSRQINLSAVPEWRRSRLLKNIILNRAESYITARLTLTGTVDAELYSPVEYEGFEEYRIASVVNIMKKGVKKAEVTLYKTPDLEEEEYVA